MRTHEKWQTLVILDTLHVCLLTLDLPCLDFRHWRSGSANSCRWKTPRLIPLLLTNYFFSLHMLLVSRGQTPSFLKDWPLLLKSCCGDQRGPPQWGNCWISCSRWDGTWDVCFLLVTFAYTLSSFHRHLTHRVSFILLLSLSVPWHAKLSCERSFVRFQRFQD